jgi:hypothetical protein
VELFIKQEENKEWDNDDIHDDQESDLFGPVIDGEAGDGGGKSGKYRI